MVTDASDDEPKNPWRGRVYVIGSADGESFWVSFNSLPAGGCIDMAVRNTGQGRDTGLSSVQMPGSGTISSAPSGGYTPPIDLAAAASKCTDRSAPNNAIAFNFRLKG